MKILLRNAVQKKLETVYDQLENQAFQGVSQKDREQFLTVLQKITCNFMQARK